MKKLVLMIPVVLIGCGKGVTGPSDVPQPSEVTRPAAYAPVPAEQVYGYYLYPRQEIPSVAGYTNVNLVTTKTVEASREAAEMARGYRMQLVPEMSSWPANWREIVQPYADAGVLHSVYVADEPMGQGMSYTELARRISEVHAAGWKAMFTEEGGHPDKPHPPVDYYGFDCYYREGDEVHSFCDGMVNRHPEINIYVPYSFYNTDARRDCKPWAYEMPNQRKQIEFARRHRLGILFFTWIDWTGDKGCHFTGVSEDPEAQAVHRQLSTAIGGLR